MYVLIVYVIRYKVVTNHSVFLCQDFRRKQIVDFIYIAKPLFYIFSLRKHKITDSQSPFSHASPYLPRSTQYFWRSPRHASVSLPWGTIAAHYLNTIGVFISYSLQHKRTPQGEKEGGSLDLLPHFLFSSRLSSISLYGIS